MRTKTSAWLFAAIWLAIAAGQSYRSFTRCADVSGWATAFWLLHAASLAAPLIAIRRARQREGRPQTQPFDVPLAFALLTYLPVTIAMRLVETCAGTE